MASLKDHAERVEIVTRASHTGTAGLARTRKRGDSDRVASRTSCVRRIRPRPHLGTSSHIHLVCSRRRKSPPKPACSSRLDSKGTRRRQAHIYRDCWDHSCLCSTLHHQHNRRCHHNLICPRDRPSRHMVGRLERHNVSSGRSEAQLTLKDPYPTHA